MTNSVVVFHFDVWGNGKQGWEVNDCNRRRMNLDATSNRLLLKSLRKEFNIPPGSVRIERGIDDIEVNRKNGKPFLTITIDRFYIQDWTGKTCFFGKMFDDFEEAWGFIREQEPDEEAWQEYYVVSTND